MQIKIKPLLDLFDTKTNSVKGDITSLISLVGEDLNCALFCHYLQESGKKIEVLSNTVPTQGLRRGKWLDRWIINHTDKIIYQCEIKNWSSSALGGKILPVDASEEKCSEIVLYHRNRELQNNFSFNSIFPNNVNKVLLKMKIPDKFKDYKNEPLIIYWMPISFDKLSPYSIYILEKSLIEKHKRTIGLFKKTHVFSVSLYLRHIKKTELNLELNNFARRLKIIDQVFVKNDK